LTPRSASNFARQITPGGRMNHHRRYPPGKIEPPQSRHPGTCLSGASDTIRTCDRCLSGLARNPSPAPAGPLPTHRQSAK
jgi:hypothetical protein